MRDLKFQGRNTSLQFLVLSLVILMAQGCKTQADIQRERTVETLNQQLVQNQKSSANSNLRLQAIEEQVQKLTGLVEETQQRKQESDKENLSLKDKVNMLEENNRKQNEAIRMLAEKVAEQTKYLEDVLKTLNSLSEQKSEPKKETKQKGNDLSVGVEDKDFDANAGGFQAAVGLYKTKNYEDAKSVFLDLVDDKKTKRKEKEGSLQYLGLIEYKKKNYDEAKVYFSRLFSEYPKSTYNATGLLYLARTFSELKQKAEASMTLEELLTRFPNSKEAKEGAKLKAKL